MADGGTTNVRIAGIDMSLGDMVVLFTKIAIALIPAFFIFMFVSWIFTMIFARTMLPSMMPR